jgi:AraC family transcriptional regulator, arabinose operon regulatory protein
VICILPRLAKLKWNGGTIWSSGEKLENNMLVFCTKGSGIVMISGEQIPVSGDQFFIIPKGEVFKYYSVINVNSKLLVVHILTAKIRRCWKNFSVVRNLIPSVNNRVANREMLFDEIFNNLSIGFHDENLEYVNFCFGHLLATFIYANKTSDDLADESNPVIRNAIDFMNKNLGRNYVESNFKRSGLFSNLLHHTF